VNDEDIVDGRRPGGANTSHTIAIELLKRLLAAVPLEAPREAYLRAAIEANVLGRATVEGRRRAVRYLRELYLLDPSRILFRALRDLWDEDPEAQAQLAGLCAFARDSVFRASAPAVLDAPPGELVNSADLTASVQKAFPDTYNQATAAKIGRNAASSWTQTGHLEGRVTKLRQILEARPASTAYALLLGHLQGGRGQAAFNTSWTGFLDLSPFEAESQADRAGQRGYLELKNAGGVVEVGFRHLLRPIDTGDRS